MKNVHRDENSPVEMIDGRLKRLHTNEIDGRERLKLREEKGGRAGKQRQLGMRNRWITWSKNTGNWKGEPTNILKRKTPVKIIEERKQRLRTSRMDTRLRTPVLRRRREGGWENKTTKDWTWQRWRGSSQLDEKCTGWKELRTNDRKTNCVILKKNLKGKRSSSKHLRQDSLPERWRGRGVKRIPTLRYN